MFVLILIAFLAACGLVAWATYAAITGRIQTWSGVLYLIALASSVIGAYFTTFKYSYLANANTRLHGWPIPTVIFQRDAPGEPWLDFVGPTLILAYPMNVVLFAFLPAFAVLVLIRFRKRSPVQLDDAKADSMNPPQPIVQAEGDSGNPYRPPVSPQ